MRRRRHRPTRPGTRRAAGPCTAWPPDAMRWTPACAFARRRKYPSAPRRPRSGRGQGQGRWPAETREAGTGWRSTRMQPMAVAAIKHAASTRPIPQIRNFEPPCAGQAAAANIPYSSNLSTNVLTDAATKENRVPGATGCLQGGRALAQISVSFFEDGGAELSGPGWALLAGGPCRGDLPAGACSGAVPVPERRQDVAVHTLTR